MQYLLSEEEYRKLMMAAFDAKAKVAAVVQDLCTRVANHEPVIIDSGDGATHETTWGCLLTTKGADFYCDRCPVQEQCPCDHKAYSK